MSDLKLSLIQTDLHWHSAEANLAMFEELIWQHMDEQPDVVVLPEMFTTGFTMAAAEHAEPMNFKTLRWMQQMAAQTKAAITGSYIVKEGQPHSQYYNRLFWVLPNGTYHTYDKRHLFRMADEHHTYTAGQQRLVVTWKGWRICPMVCYDLRFPVWSRNTSSANGSMDFDLLLYVANWPAARVNAWDILLQARAVENLCYVAGVNRTGNDGKGIAYNGHSQVASPKGEVLTHLGQQPATALCTISEEALDGLRTKFPAYLDADRFTIEQ